PSATASAPRVSLTEGRWRRRGGIRLRSCPISICSGAMGECDSARRRAWAPPPLDGYRPMIVNVALTGAVPGKADNPLVPLTPEEIAADAIACAKAGASVVHVHVRDEDGMPVHRRDLYERAITPIREQAPEVAICVTTSSRVDPDPAARVVGLELEEALR